MGFAACLDLRAQVIDIIFVLSTGSAASLKLRAQLQQNNNTGTAAIYNIKGTTANLEFTKGHCCNL